MSVVNCLARKFLKFHTFTLAFWFLPFAVLSFLPEHHLVCLADKSPRWPPRVLASLSPEDPLSVVNGEPQPFGFSLVPAAEDSPRALCDLPASCFLLNLRVQRLDHVKSSCYLAASKTSGSAPLGLAHVYLENNLGSTKEKKLFAARYARDCFLGIMVGLCPGWSPAL